MKDSVIKTQVKTLKFQQRQYIVAGRENLLSNINISTGFFLDCSTDNLELTIL
jgi:hypothetical protein